MASLPQVAKVYTTDRLINQLQTNIIAVVNPLAAQPFNSGLILTNVNLVTGNNVINHTLGRLQLGWIITDIQGSSDIYRVAPFNDTTLTLSSGADVTVNILVF